MIQKYIYGTPIETGAVVQNIEETKADFSLMKLEKCEETKPVPLRETGVALCCAKA